MNGTRIIVLKLSCCSIPGQRILLLPNEGRADLPENLDLKIGNVFRQSLDEIFNGPDTQKIQKEYVHNCNQCWLNFHRKYDVVLYRTRQKNILER